MTLKSRVERLEAALSRFTAENGRLLPSRDERLEWHEVIPILRDGVEVGWRDPRGGEDIDFLPGETGEEFIKRTSPMPPLLFDIAGARD